MRLSAPILAAGVALRVAVVRAEPADEGRIRVETGSPREVATEVESSLPGEAGDRLAARHTPFHTGAVPGRSGAVDAPHQRPTLTAHRRIEAVTSDALPVRERIRRLRAEDAVPVVDDFDRLTGFIEAETLPADMRRTAYHYLANEIWNLLRHADSVPAPRLARHLADLARGAEDPVIRDYALQHLGRMREPEVGVGAPAAGRQPAVRDLQRETFAAVAADPENASAGTALIALRDLIARSGDASRPADLHTAILALLANGETRPPTRVTAMAMAADFELDGALPAARAVLADPRADARLRLTAIRLIGATGNTADVRVLEEARHTFAGRPFLFSAARRATAALERPSAERPLSQPQP